MQLNKEIFCKGNKRVQKPRVFHFIPKKENVSVIVTKYSAVISEE
jgi:hypothetical protein